jgi:NADH dehydrogenase FAD-containing subunit
MSAHHVVVVGAGFGGLETVHRLAGALSASPVPRSPIAKRGIATTARKR